MGRRPRERWIAAMFPIRKLTVASSRKAESMGEKGEHPMEPVMGRNPVF